MPERLTSDPGFQIANADRPHGPAENAVALFFRGAMRCSEITYLPAESDAWKRQPSILFFGGSGGRAAGGEDGLLVDEAQQGGDED